MQIFKIGTFLMVVGAIILVLFVVSVRGGVEDNAGYLLWGLGIFVLGYFLWHRFPGPRPDPSGRFRILKGSGKTKRVNRSRSRWEEDEEEEDR